MSKVYYTNMRARAGNNLLDKLKNLLDESDISDINFEKKFVALKIHFGERGNLAVIKPQYVRVIVDFVKSKGGIPFLTDTSTLYSGLRDNAVNHLETATFNGFLPEVTGCPVVIADGLKGTEFREISINLKHCKKAKIGSAIADADIILTLNHFKGHEVTGFAGAIKNIGMGCGSRGGKLEMHSGSQPRFRRGKCVSCALCVKNCAESAIKLDKDKKAYLLKDKCVGCGQCIAMCRYNAVQVVWDKGFSDCCEKIAEYSLAVLRNKPNYHINFITDVSPDCDCWSHNDLPIVADQGFTASSDPVAIDIASSEIVNRAAMTPGCRLEDGNTENIDQCNKFQSIHSNTDWRTTMNYCEKLGVGQKVFEIVKLDTD